MELTSAMKQDLAPFEENFRTALSNGYTRNLTYAERGLLFDTYRRLSGDLDGFPCISCSADLVGVLKFLGKLYFEEPAPEAKPAVGPAKGKKTKEVTAKPVSDDKGRAVRCD